ncbi:ATP-binding cassette domain-containing protein [Paenibacillus lautus]|uniref:ATP-binding cassette domain-containing protein n=1 Tax=Paenibacillus lautus TaxID=1401 RepID=UPI003D9A0C99
MDYVLQTFGLTKRYGNMKAVSGVNLKVGKGDIYGLIGKNGAGKTTLLRMLTGLTTPTEGEIQVFGKKSDQANPRILSRIGSLIESPALYPDFTVQEHMELRARLLGIRDKGFMEETLEAVCLEDEGKKKVKHFFLGMKQRLGLALALLGSPDLLVLDEPMNGLDPAGIADLRKLLRRLNRERDITIVISSHALGELSKLATRYGILHCGELIDERTSEELERKSRRYVKLGVDNVGKTCFVLEDTFRTSDYEVRPNGTIHVFDLLDRSGELCLELARHCVKVVSIETKGEDLEAYFMRLTEGGRYA